MDVNALSTQQLSAVKKQIDEELEHLTTSYNQLRAAQTKFASCASIVERTIKGDSYDQKHVLVPLTSSLYVPARLATRDRVLIDVGTGFYLEKNTTDACAFYKRKGDDLGKNMKDVEKLVQGKTGNLRAVEEVLRQKIITSQETGTSSSNA